MMDNENKTIGIKKINSNAQKNNYTYNFRESEKICR